MQLNEQKVARSRFERGYGPPALIQVSIAEGDISKHGRIRGPLLGQRHNLLTGVTG